MALPVSRAGNRSLTSWKVRIFIAGAVLGLAGIYRSENWMVGLAIGLLAVGFLLRFVGRESATDATDPTDDAGVGGDAP